MPSASPNRWAPASSEGDGLCHASRFLLSSAGQLDHPYGAKNPSSFHRAKASPPPRIAQPPHREISPFAGKPHQLPLFRCRAPRIQAEEFQIEGAVSSISGTTPLEARPMPRTKSVDGEVPASGRPCASNLLAPTNTLSPSPPRKDPRCKGTEPKKTRKTR